MASKFMFIATAAPNALAVPGLGIWDWESLPLRLRLRLRPCPTETTGMNNLIIHFTCTCGAIPRYLFPSRGNGKGSHSAKDPGMMKERSGSRLPLVDERGIVRLEMDKRWSQRQM